MRILLSRLFGALLMAVTLVAAPPAHAAETIPVTIVLATDRTVVDPEHPTVTITGRVTGQRPDEEPHPLAGRTVHLQGHWQSPSWDAVTDDNGEFSTTWSPGQFGSTVEAKVDPSGDYAGASATTETVTRNVAKTRMTVAFDRAKVNQGEQVMLSGLVEWQAGAEWRPVAGADVLLTMPNNCSHASQTARAKTGADGRYQAKASPACDTGVSATALHPSYLYEEARAAATTNLIVRPRPDISLSGSMGVWGEVSLNGGIYPRDPAAYRDLSGVRIIIEYSPNGRDGWREHRRVRTEGSTFSSRFTVNYSGYWRARYAGRADTQPGVSPVLKLWRWGTRMSKIKASPTKVRRNGYTTVSGTLTRYHNLQQTKPTPFKGQKVRIIFRFKGEKTWYHLAWDTTDSKGVFSRKVRAYGDGYYAAIFHGTKTTWAVGSPNEVFVDTYGSTSAGVQSTPGPVVPAPPALPWQGGPAQAALTPAG